MITPRTDNTRTDESAVDDTKASANATAISLYDKERDGKLRLSALDFAIRASQTSDTERTVDAAKKFYVFLTAKAE